MDLFLRGYYRCSSSKGCSARKQVERSRTDPNMLVITYTSEHNHPWPTQRNALAGSIRSSSSSSSSNPSSKSSTATTIATTSASSRVSQNKDESNSSQFPSSSTPPPPYVAVPTVKEEDVEKRRDNKEFYNDVDDTYRPEFQHQLENFFDDLDELEEDSLNMLLSQGFAGDSSSGGNMEKYKTTIPDVFSDFFDDDSSRSL